MLVGVKRSVYKSLLSDTANMTNQLKQANTKCENIQKEYDDYKAKMQPYESIQLEDAKNKTEKESRELAEKKAAEEKATAEAKAKKRSRRESCCRGKGKKKKQKKKPLPKRKPPRNKQPLKLRLPKKQEAMKLE